MTKERLAQILRDLEARQAEAGRQQQQIAAFEKQQTEAQQRIEGLNVAVKVAEQEKVMLRENLEEAKQQVAVERQERQKALAQTGQLAEGVGKLAEKYLHRKKPSQKPQEPQEKLNNPVPTQ